MRSDNWWHKPSDSRTEPADEAPSAIRPAHYRQHPSGIEAIQITEGFGFNLGNVVKYVWRADMKGGIEDLEKAAWYLAREIGRRKAQKQEDDE
jgi:hypothetical protein